MSSWLSLPLPNPFKSYDEEEEEEEDDLPPPAGDLAVLGQSIGRQLRGVASFLAPPPSPPPADDFSSSSQTLVGIKNDLVEIGGSFKSLLSSNKAVTEISRFANNLLQFEDDEIEVGEEAVGITDQVLDFVKEISLRPECWTDFPLSLQNDFDMSQIQREHAAIIEHYVPDLKALRQKVCSDLSEDQFWMIYFILLLPRLDENDASLLSTPKIIPHKCARPFCSSNPKAQLASTREGTNVKGNAEMVQLITVSLALAEANIISGMVIEVREMLLQKLRNKKNAPAEIPKESESETVNTLHNDENMPLEKVPTEGVGQSNLNENTDRWLEEEDLNTSASVDSKKQPQNEEDISFSDLEDDEDDNDRFSGRQSGFRSDEGKMVTSRSESSEWVQLSEDERKKGAVAPSSSREKDSEGENDWLTIDDGDF
ncbi:hypothetical protein LguiB_010442 [Lonicera macranthoides]